jgi:hypothetical protein
MNNAILSVAAALIGSTVGGLAPVLSNYVLQRGQTRRDLLNRQLTLRESLYSDFIKEASGLFANSLTHSCEDLDEMVSIYAIVSRIRLMASGPVVHAAESFVKKIIQHYEEPNLSVEQLRSAALSAKADPLEAFSLACRKELQDILREGALSATIRT